MSDELPGRICPVPPFDNSDKELVGGCLLAILTLLVFSGVVSCYAIKQRAESGAVQSAVTTAELEVDDETRP